ncbi:MAG: glycosyltransferase family 2 protein [Solirubrobacteraceae bacterium]
MTEPGVVSIVTPTLEGACYLAQALESVRMQDYPAIEHVVVDGGSTDGTLALLEHAAGVTWLSEPDGGQADAINKGFARARGEFVAWLNADDYYLPGAVSAAVRALRERPDAALAYANYLTVDERTGGQREVRPPRFELKVLLRHGNLISTPTVFMRRSALDTIGELDTTLQYVFDYDLWARFARRFPLLYRDELWSAFRLHDGSKTVADYERFWVEEDAVLRRYAGRRRALLPHHRLARIEHQHPFAGRLLRRSTRLGRLMLRGEFGEVLRRVAAARRRPPDGG